MSAREGGHAEVALPDMERRQANAIRYGKVFEIDYALARVRVRSGEVETGWLPWHAGRASADSKTRWDPPALGEQVLVLSPGGDMRQGLVVPGVYQDAAPPPDDDPMKDVAEYADGTRIEYDRALHALSISIMGGLTSIFADTTKIELKVGASVLLLTAAGLTHNGVNVGSTHVHSGVIPGPSNTGGPQ